MEQQNIAKEIFINAGKKGGSTTAKRYSKEIRSKWGRRGGRPRKVK